MDGSCGGSDGGSGSASVGSGTPASNDTGWTPIDEGRRNSAAKYGPSFESPSYGNFRPRYPIHVEGIESYSQFQRRPFDNYGSDLLYGNFGRGSFPLKIVPKHYIKVRAPDYFSKSVKGSRRTVSPLEIGSFSEAA